MKNLNEMYLIDKFTQIRFLTAALMVDCLTSIKASITRKVILGNYVIQVVCKFCIQFANHNITYVIAKKTGDIITD